MKSDWILDVIHDLKIFAQNNGLPALAEQLDDVAIVAFTEISTSNNVAGASSERSLLGDGYE